MGLGLGGGLISTHTCMQGRDVRQQPGQSGLGLGLGIGVMDRCIVIKPVASGATLGLVRFGVGVGVRVKDSIVVDARLH